MLVSTPVTVIRLRIHPHPCTPNVYPLPQARRVGDRGFTTLVMVSGASLVGFRFQLHTLLSIHSGVNTRPLPLHLSLTQTIALKHST